MKSRTRAQFERLVLKVAKAERKERIRESIAVKSRVVDQIKELLKQYRVLAIMAVDRAPAAESRRIYGRLSEYGVVKLYKNSLVLRALRDLGAKNVDRVSEYLTGSNIFMFTNMNPFKLAKVVEEFVEYRYAKPGDTLDFDVELSPGPTGVKPGPSMSLFGKLKIPTQVREGVIWIAKETKVLKRGDAISPELSSLMRRLGVRVVPVRIQLKAVYEDGHIYLPKDLKIDFEAVKKDLVSAISMSRLLAVELAIPVPEVVPDLLTKAYRASVELAAAIGYVTPEIAQNLLMKALAQAIAVAQAISGRVDLGVGVGVEKREERREEEKKEVEEEREKEAEEELAEGIASLFG
ncbi:MAG: 50S ribosomal protein L10 [Sulfolobales archaeon]|nr:50S ribosomal protein L10 [Sulfolobales archaeon]MCX8208250.1 50S ribosomal protein L10 [Sulfolobales archaeon]MDW8010269.1 50S ribosomal protein L10 [Sulfolobales archaeon]